MSCHAATIEPIDVPSRCELDDQLLQHFSAPSRLGAGMPAVDRTLTRPSEPSTAGNLAVQLPPCSRIPSVPSLPILNPF